MIKEKNKSKISKRDKERSAGILLHITSLPSAFGIGDLGPEAFVFADFLSAAYQSYWQLLPLNPTESGKGHSPYSSTSSLAGNILLISPEELYQDGLLGKKDLMAHKIPASGKVNFKKAETTKQILFAKAYNNFIAKKSTSLHTAFTSFCRKENYWLDDFAIYSVLKKINQGKPWYEWADHYRNRDKRSLKNIRTKYKAGYNKIRWLQFIFFKQWNNLKQYCNQKNIKLFGDLPFYISYDSVDVWSQPEFFSLDKNRNMIGVAGVPPDYFNADGQLWGMPVFRWEVLKKAKYDWWIARIKKNMELYDLLRLDHFRAFADYWEVPAKDNTARNGTWKKGPDHDFFEALKRSLQSLDFVAEDLGDINEKVFQLRDDFALPGMKVLQFAFGDTLPTSEYIPHNYNENFVVYTGTHDNNTTRGWFRQDADASIKTSLKQYVHQAVTDKNVHLLLSRLAYASVAKIAIIPMQDVIGLDETARMNTPASTQDNWLWRVRKKDVNKEAVRRLQGWTVLFNRKDNNL